jgi:hypothetical protein
MDCSRWELRLSTAKWVSAEYRWRSHKWYYGPSNWCFGRPIWQRVWLVESYIHTGYQYKGSNILLGSYISAADAPYSQRALPPSNLDTSPSAPDFPYNYHIYKVLKPLSVVGGPIAPWFGQPGLGAQFYTGGTGNIMALIAAGYLERLNATVLVSGSDKGCS